MCPLLIQDSFPAGNCTVVFTGKPGRAREFRDRLRSVGKNFALHGHDPAHWHDNWRQCPEELEVLELGRYRKEVNVKVLDTRVAPPPPAVFESGDYQLI